MLVPKLLAHVCPACAPHPDSKQAAAPGSLACKGPWQSLALGIAGRQLPGDLVGVPPWVQAQAVGGAQQLRTGVAELALRLVLKCRRLQGQELVPAVCALLEAYKLKAMDLVRMVSVWSASRTMELSVFLFCCQKQRC